MKEIFKFGSFFLIVAALIALSEASPPIMDDSPIEKTKIAMVHTWDFSLITYAPTIAPNPEPQERITYHPANALRNEKAGIIPKESAHERIRLGRSWNPKTRCRIFYS